MLAITFFAICSELDVTRRLVSSISALKAWSCVSVASRRDLNCAVESSLSLERVSLLSVGCKFSCMNSQIVSAFSPGGLALRSVATALIPEAALVFKLGVALIRIKALMSSLYFTVPSLGIHC